MGLKERFKKWFTSKKQEKNIVLTEEQVEQLIAKWETTQAQPMVNGEVFGFNSKFVNEAEQFCKTKSEALKKMSNFEQKKNAYNESFDIFSEDYSLNYSNAVYNYELSHNSICSTVETSQIANDKKQALSVRIETSHSAVMAKKSEYDTVMQKAEDVLNAGFQAKPETTPSKK